MPKPMLVFCADLQARESAYKAVRELYGDDLYALTQVVDHCVANNLPLVLVGDQVDTPVISDAHVIELRRILRRNVDAGNVNLYVDGNHERGFRRLSLEGGAASCAENMEALNDHEVFEDFSHGCSVAGYNWRTRKQWEGVLEGGALPETDILILHGLAQQSVPMLNLPGIDGPLCDLDLSWFDGNHRLVLMGDVHLEWDWTGPKGTRFLYSGSMWMHRLGEPQEKSFIVVNDDLSVERRPLRCRPFYQAMLLDDQHVEQAAAWLKANRDPEDCDAMRRFMGPVLPRMHLTVPLELTPSLRAALKDFEEQAHVFRKVLSASDGESPVQGDSPSGRATLTEALAQVLDMQDPAARDAAEFVEQAVNSGLDHAIDDLKRKVGLV